METKPAPGEPLGREAGLGWLVARIRRRPGRTMVAIDGVDGAGKSTFADDLAVELTDSGLEVIRISMDDFLNPAAVRHAKGLTSPEGFIADTYDYERFIDDVLDPLSSEGCGRYRSKSYDFSSESPLSPPWKVAPEPVVTVVDGMFLHRDRLRNARGRKIWDLSVWLEVPFSISVGRLAVRDGTPADPTDERNVRYVAGQQLYIDKYHPAERADLVIDNSP